MRDPDLVTRAQRAAVALERAWERWRAMHGLSADPMPPVSSYVGYSIQEPWGRPRVVFGVDAREAELLAALLDHHECVGPFYTEPPSGTAYGIGAPASSDSPLDEARSRIPAQAQAAEQRPSQRDQDAQPGPADGGPAVLDADGLGGAAGDAHDDQLHYPDGPLPEEPSGENGVADPPRHDETRGSNGRGGDQRRGRRTEPSRPSRRERRAASRQRSAATRGPGAGQGHSEAARAAAAHKEPGPAGAAEHAANGSSADTAWPADAAAPSWTDREADAMSGAAPGGLAPGSPGSGSAGPKGPGPGGSALGNLGSDDSASGAAALGRPASGGSAPGGSAPGGLGARGPASDSSASAGPGSHGSAPGISAAAIPGPGGSVQADFGTGGPASDSSAPGGPDLHRPAPGRPGPGGSVPGGLGAGGPASDSSASAGPGSQAPRPGRPGKGGLGPESLDSGGLAPDSLAPGNPGSRGSVPGRSASDGSTAGNLGSVTPAPGGLVSGSPGSPSAASGGPASGESVPGFGPGSPATDGVAPGRPASGGFAQVSPGSGSAAVDITTVDAIPVQSGPAERGADPGDATREARAPRAKSLYDVTKASRERARRRGAGSAADRRQGTARDLAQGHTAGSGSDGKPGGDPVSSTEATGAAYPVVGPAGLGVAAPGPITPESAASGPPGPDLSGQDLSGQDLAGEGRAGEVAGAPQHGLGGATADQGPVCRAPLGPDHVDSAANRHAAEAQWAQDTDPGINYTTDQDLDYADDGRNNPGDEGWDCPGDDGWDDMAAPGESWDNGLAAAAGPGGDRGGDPGRSDMAGLDQLWGIGRGTPGHGQDQAPDAAGRQDQDMGPEDAAGPGTLGDTGPGSMRDAAAAAPAGTTAHGARNAVATTDASALPDTGPSQARDAGSARDNGSARDIHPARDTGAAEHGTRENGRGPESGSAWEGSAFGNGQARDTGSGRDTVPGPAGDSARDLPEDYGPDPLGAPGGRETADFLSAPPPSGSILTTASREETRTARPANPGSQTIAAELAGWAAGELPGQASARLAAWAAIGGVPAAEHRRTDGSDVGSAGVATERVR